MSARILVASRLFLLIGCLCFVGCGGASSPPLAQPPVISPEAKVPLRGCSVSVPYIAPGSPLIELPISGGVVFGPTGCPNGVVGDKLIELASGKELGQIAFKDPASGDHHHDQSIVLSQSGRYVAWGMVVSGDVKVWDAQQSKIVLTVPKTRFGRYLSFSRDQYLLVAAQDRAQVEVWNVAEGKAAKTLNVPGGSSGPALDNKNLAFTPDGRHFAVWNTYDKKLSLGTTAAAQLIELAVPSDVKLDDLEAFDFSPDSLELAAYVSSKERASDLLCWGLDGKVVQRVTFSPPHYDSQARLICLPDQAGWIVNGVVIDRPTRLTVLRFAKSSGADWRLHALDKNRLVLDYGQHRTSSDSAKHQLTLFEIPWETMQKSLAALNDESAAWISPKQPLGFERVAVESGSTDLTGVDESLRRQLTRDMSQGGSQLKSTADTQLRISVKTMAGERMRVKEQQSPTDFRGRDTGRTVRGQRARVTFDLLAGGQALPGWHEEFGCDSSRYISGAVNDSSIERSLIREISEELRRIDIPYFLPKSPELLPLPVVVR